uniref:Uncharacterized protein n=1 Tax=Lygus hesperus TaxID=30085 RepID=A0A0A9W7W2_LYGHE
MSLSVSIMITWTTFPWMDNLPGTFSTSMILCLPLQTLQNEPDVEALKVEAAWSSDDVFVRYSRASSLRWRAIYRLYMKMEFEGYPSALSAATNAWLLYNAKHPQNKMTYLFFKEMVPKQLEADEDPPERPTTPKRLHTLVKELVKS